MRSSGQWTAAVSERAFHVVEKSPSAGWLKVSSAHIKVDFNNAIDFLTYKICDTNILYHGVIFWIVYSQKYKNYEHFIQRLITQQSAYCPVVAVFKL